MISGPGLPPATGRKDLKGGQLTDCPANKVSSTVLPILGAWPVSTVAGKGLGELLHLLQATAKRGRGEEGFFPLPCHHMADKVGGGDQFFPRSCPQRESAHFPIFPPHKQDQLYCVRQAESVGPPTQNTAVRGQGQFSLVV